MFLRSSSGGGDILDNVDEEKAVRRGGGREKRAGAMAASLGSATVLFAMLCSSLERAATGWPWAGQVATVLSIEGNARWGTVGAAWPLGISGGSSAAEMLTAMWLVIEISLPLMYLAGVWGPHRTAWVYIAYQTVLFAVFQEPLLFLAHHMAAALLIAASGRGGDNDDDDLDVVEDPEDSDSDTETAGKAKVD
jgi:hypothetical protein